MVVRHDFRQMFPIQVHINFCSGDGFMTKHHLNGAQIGSVFQQMRSKGMPESMRTNGFIQVNFYGQVFNNGKHHGPGQLFSSPIQKKRVFKTLLNDQMISNLIFVQHNIALGRQSYWHKTLFVTFPRYFNKTFLKEQIRYFQRN